MAYEFVGSPNYTLANNALGAYGVKRTFQVIVIHWWDDPAKKPKIESVITHFQNTAAQVSAHYVVNDSRTVQMVQEQHVAWHAKKANPISIGIECDPNGGEPMYRRLGELVKDIRSRHGNLPLKKHSEYVQTSCPGTIDLNKIDQYAQGAPVNETADREFIRQMSHKLLLRKEPMGDAEITKFGHNKKTKWQLVNEWVDSDEAKENRKKLWTGTQTTLTPGELFESAVKKIMEKK